MTTILDKIVAVKRQEVAQARQRTAAGELKAALADAPAPRDFHRVLAASGPIKLIAEIKKASPSKGVIRADFRPLEIARIYERAGATCLSVLTDQQFFQGSLDVLQAVRNAVDLPILRKDFVIDAYQVLEARAAGADAVLLIAECLDDDALRSLHDAIVELGMTALVEFHDRRNLPRVLELGAKLVGVNNRDLHTFATDLDHTARLRREIPDDRTVVGESGIESRADVVYLQEAGVNAMLVGQRLMADRDIAAAVHTLLGTRPSDRHGS